MNHIIQDTIANESKYLQQLTLEEEMRDAGISKYRNTLAQVSQEGLETTTTGGLQLLKNAIEPYTERLKMHFNETGKRGRKSYAEQLLKGIEPEVIAFLTAKSVLNSVTQKTTLTRAAIKAASALEDEIRFRTFKENNPNFYQAVHNRIHKKNSYDYKRTVLVHSMGKIQIPWESWTDSEKVHIGNLCIGLLEESTGLVQKIQIPTNKNETVLYVTATDKTLDWLDKEHRRCELLSPHYLPMVIEPKPWTALKDGGYYGVLADSLQLIKSHNPNFLDEIANLDMPEVYEAVNHIQSTAWQINQNVLAVAQHFWERDTEIAGLPPRNDRQPRTCPLPRELKSANMTESQLNILRDWKREAASIYDKNIENRSKRVLFSKILYVAEKFQEEPKIYFPHAMDFRGRVYAIPNFLNPQGNDLSKGLLHFSEGKAIMDETAARWLAIHGANLYGYDKVGFDERVAYIQSMTNLIGQIVSNPYENLEWAEADKPWQFLAFCFEWAAFTQQGYGFISHLPIALDGSCNGLQHFSAMLRDPVGGEAVNLMPSHKPQDIYQRVADRVLEKLNRDATEETEFTTLAKQWLEFGVDRQMTKRPVMILPYGGTRQACRFYVEETIRDRLNHGAINYFANSEQDNIFHASLYLSKIIWESIGEIVIAARQAMDWLRFAARLISSEGLPVNWISPSGFPVQQAYYNTQTRRIKTQLGGNITRKIYLSLPEILDSIDKREQANGISPNFVHSMDAAALHLFVNRAKSLNIQSLSMVHDSYGTLAADTEISAQCIREVFVEMYQQDVLANFRSDLLDLLSPKNAKRLPPLPPKGNLDLEVVKQSAFFFA